MSVETYTGERRPDRPDRVCRDCGTHCSCECCLLWDSENWIENAKVMPLGRVGARFGIDFTADELDVMRERLGAKDIVKKLKAIIVAEIERVRRDSMIRPHPKRKRPVKKSTLRNKADALFSKLIRSAGACAKCGATDRLQTSHFISRRYLAVRWNLLNAECLCAACHKGFTEHPLEAEVWAAARLGSDVYVELKRLAMRGGVPDYRAVIALLTEELEATA